MKKYLTLFKRHFIPFVAFGFVASNVFADAAPTLSEFHPTVVASLGEEKIAVFFLKNSLKALAKEEHVADAEIYYSSLSSGKPSLNYVWKVEGDQIASVFFYEWKSPARAGKSMFVLTKRKVSNSAFDGFAYSVMELPIRREGGSVSLLHFSGDLPDPALDNCLEGADLVAGNKVVCAYKDAASIKNYFSLQDKKH
ncbi:hypothetical protein [Pseudomonas sp. HS6]|uniref:hypothetical protein n=1 Tax=Pseudomonas sp. HS6 TaxID=2850559 RepID=UPI002018835E|nr:hypothetical protein [Pseudomonas sp. HS6]UQS13384.1 hypothetical protein JJN09_19445 [Pseudomonas sp. HS6]